jgi:hypothetical protein
MIAIPGEEAPADPPADLGAEAGLSDTGAHFLLAPVRLEGEAAAGLLGQPLLAQAGACRAVADPAADAAADETATKARLKIGVMGRNDGLGHETPPSASSPSRGELPAFISSSYPLCAGRYARLGSGESKGEADRPRDGFGGDSRRSPSGNGCGARLFEGPDLSG